MLPLLAFSIHIVCVIERVCTEKNCLYTLFISVTLAITNSFVLLLLLLLLNIHLHSLTSPSPLMVYLCLYVSSTQFNSKMNKYIST